VSTFYDQASLVLIPSGYKEDVVYSQKPTDGSGDLTFTRASDGTRVNSQGYVERVPWNLLQQSNTFSTTWGNSNTTETGGQADKDGGNNAWLLTKSASNGYLIQSLAQAGVQTASIYAKASDSDWLYLQAVGTSTASCYFDLINGTTGSTGSLIDKSIELIGNGWYRCSITYNQTLSNFRIYPAEANSLSASSGSVFIQDAQLVEGTTAKPYFPTTDRLNVPRLDYSNGCPSLLLEPQRTNLRTHSDDFNNISPSNVTVTSNDTTSPDGTANADKLTPSGTGFHTVGNTISVTAGQKYTISVFYKYGTHKNIGFYDNNTSGSEITINLETNAFTLAANVDDGGIVPYGNGWYRAYATFTAASSNMVNYIIFRNDANNGNYTATGAYSYFYGWQIEQGSYSTSYIPTTSAAVTRVADAAYKTGISSLIGQTEGTMFLDFVLDSVDGLNDFRFSVSEGALYNNEIFIGMTNGYLRAFMQESGSAVYDSGNISPIVGTRYKMALAYANNDVVFYVNGTQKNTSSSATIPNTDEITIGNRTDSKAMVVKETVNQAALFKTRLTNTELAALTTL